MTSAPFLHRRKHAERRQTAFCAEGIRGKNPSGLRDDYGCFPEPSPLLCIERNTGFRRLLLHIKNSLIKITSVSPDFLAGSLSIIFFSSYLVWYKKGSIAIGFYFLLAMCLIRRYADTPYVVYPPVIKYPPEKSL